MPPIARWFSTDEFRKIARRNCEKQALEFCKKIIHDGRLEHAASDSSRLARHKCSIDTTRIAVGGFSVLFTLVFDRESDRKAWVIRIRKPHSG